MTSTLTIRCSFQYRLVVVYQRDTAGFPLIKTDPNRVCVGMCNKNTTLMPLLVFQLPFILFGNKAALGSVCLETRQNTCYLIPQQNSSTETEQHIVCINWSNCILGYSVQSWMWITGSSKLSKNICTVNWFTYQVTHDHIQHSNLALPFNYEST